MRHQLAMQGASVVLLFVCCVPASTRPLFKDVSKVQLIPSRPTQNGGVVTELMFREILADAEPRKWSDPERGYWAYDPWYSGEFSTADGRFEFVLHHGGALTLTSPGGVQSLFTYRVLAELEVFQARVAEGRELVVTRRPVDLDFFPNVNSVPKPLPQGHAVVPATGLSVVQVLIRNERQVGAPIFSYLLPEYPEERRFTVIDFKEDGPYLLLLTQEPMLRSYFLRIITPGAGIARTVIFGEWDQDRAMQSWISLNDVDMRLGGSLRGGDLSVRIVDQRRRDAPQPARYRYRLSADSQRMELELQ